ncbi:MAG: DegV family protein [Chloroflexota bacterium]
MGGGLKVRIVSDSSCDLPRETIEAHGISVVPLTISIEGKSYRDGVDISRSDFYQRLPSLKTFPTTSAPSPGAFLEEYDRLVREGAREIVSVHISPTLSAVVNSARLAAEELTSTRVTLVDSRQLSLGTGYMVLAAARAAADGADGPEIAAILDELAPRVHVFALLNTVEFLRRSGRINGIQSGIASILDIKPILKMNQGKAAMERVRTRRAGIDRLMSLFEGLGPLEEVAVIHTNALDKANDLFERARGLLTFGESVPSVDVTPVIGAHIGPGTVGFACVAASRSAPD